MIIRYVLAQGLTICNSDLSATVQSPSSVNDCTVADSSTFCETLGYSSHQMIMAHSSSHSGLYKSYSLVIVFISLLPILMQWTSLYQIIECSPAGTNE